jgi:predicted AlkP superfamily pyrophosphatase or phosphodiesterase
MIKKTLFQMLMFCVISTTALFAQKVKKTVFIIVDGIPADVVEKQPTPNLHAIAKEGGYTRSYVGGVKGAYSETPTISAVGYNSLLTGTWVNKLNVWDNDIAEPNYHYPTVFRLLKESYPQKKTAIFSSWLDNRTKLVGDELAATGNIKIDYHFDGLELDTIQYPHDQARDFMSNIDEAVSQQAATTIKQDAPDLSWVYLEYTDDMGHMHGDSPEFYKAIALADKRVGYIWDAIQYRQKNFNEDWLIIVTTDHGRTAETGKGHGGQSDRERDGWIFTNAKNLNEQFGTPQSSIVDILPAIIRFMDIHPSQKQAFEMDGLPFIGKLLFAKPRIKMENGSLHVDWKNLAKGEMTILATTTNEVKTGGEDHYKVLATVPLAQQSATIKLDNLPSDFYKVVLQSGNENFNYWIKK